MGTSDGGVFVGRRAELAAGAELLRRAVTGTGGVLVVGGEAGAGKTRLLEVLAEEARAHGFRVASGACLRLDAGAIPYGALVTALRGLVRAGDPGLVAASLGAQRREVGRLVPEVLRLGTQVTAPVAASVAAAPATLPAEPRGGAEPAPPSRPLPAGPDERDVVPDPLARLRLFEAVAGWLERLAAAAPVVLIVEDLHWADPATLDLVRALALSAVRAPLVLAVSVRTDEPPAPVVATTIAELVRDDALRLELAPFERPELAELAARVAPDLAEPELEDLLERTGGNPFFAVELLEARRAGGELPASLRDVLVARIDSLAPAELAILRAAALMTRTLDDELLADAIGCPVRDVGDALRAARDAGLLAPDRTRQGGGLRFRHAIVRDVLVEDTGPGERRMLHAAFARALARRAGESPDPGRRSAIAQHLDAAGDEGAAVLAHVQALDAAERAFAFDAAVSHARRAAELLDRAGRSAARGGPGGSAPPPAVLLERASYAAYLAGDPAGSVELARAALARTTDPERRDALLDRVRWGLWEVDREAAAREIAEAAPALLEGPPSRTQARVLAQLAAVRMGEADPTPALELTERSATSARRAGAPEIEALALGIRGRTLAVHGRVDEGVDALRRALALAERLGSLQGVVTGRSTIVEVLARAGRVPETLAEVETGLAEAARLGLGRSLGPQLLAEAARVRFTDADWDGALHDVAEGLARRPVALVEARLRTIRLRVAVARGDEPGVDADEHRLAALAPVLADPEDVAALLMTRAERALLAGRPGEVRPLLDAGLALVASGAEPGPSLAWLGALGVEAEVELAIDARARGDAAAEAEAGTRLERLWTVVQREAGGARVAWGARTEALVAHVLAELSRLDPDAAARVAAWERAVAGWAALGRPASVAWARVRLAEARLAAGQPRDAVAAVLVPAAETLRSLGAGPQLAAAERLARMARIDLVPGGRTPPVQDGAGDTLGLTAREREVLVLVAAGWSNARIADELGMATKTASVHVSNILAKLGATNRVEAAAIAHRLGFAEVRHDAHRAGGR